MKTEHEGERKVLVIEADMKMTGEDHHTPDIKLREGPTRDELAESADKILALAEETGIPIKIEEGRIEWSDLNELIQEKLDSVEIIEPWRDLCLDFGRVKITIEQIDPPETSDLLPEEAIAQEDPEDAKVVTEQEIEYELDEEEALEAELEAQAAATGYDHGGV